MDHKAEIDAENKDGNTPLHFAARRGHIDVVKYLIEEKGANSTIPNNEGKNQVI